MSDDDFEIGDSDDYLSPAEEAVELLKRGLTSKSISKRSGREQRQSERVRQSIMESKRSSVMEYRALVTSQQLMKISPSVGKIVSPMPRVLVPDADRVQVGDTLLIYDPSYINHVCVKVYGIRPDFFSIGLLRRGS